MKELTAFTWGYWGWGTHAKDFVYNIDIAERARGWRPPLFVDIRIRRTGRAPDFMQNAFEKIVGQGRYRWMPKLGNLRVLQNKRGVEIADPDAAKDLLEHIRDANRQKRRVLFFCACETPGTAHSPTCHRVTVAGYVLKEARRRGVRLTIAEWPGKEPKVDQISASSQVVRNIARGASRIPLPRLNPKDRQKFFILPWCSRINVSSDDGAVAVIAGPAKLGRDWFLPIICPEKRKTLDTLASLQKTASRLRRLRGYEAIRA